MRGIISVLKVLIGMEIDSQDFDILKQLEEELWQDTTRFDIDKMEALLAPDFFEFGRSGRIYQREDTLNLFPHSIHATLPLPDFCIRLLSPDIAQVTYKSAVTSDGIVLYANRSSIWSRSDRRWQLRFHQGTPVAEPEANVIK